MRNYKNLRRGSALKTFQQTRMQAKGLLKAKSLSEYNAEKAAAPDWLTRIIPFYGQRVSKEQLAKQREFDKAIDKELDTLVNLSSTLHVYLNNSLTAYAAAWQIAQEIKNSMDNIPNVAPTLWANYPGLQDFVKKVFPGGFYRLFPKEESINKGVSALEEVLSKFSEAMAKDREWQPEDIYKSFKDFETVEDTNYEEDLSPTIASIYRRRSSGSNYGELARKSMRKALINRKLAKRNKRIR